MNQRQALDALDIDLIRALRAGPRSGVLELSRTLGVARGTVQARLERMESSGVITGYGPDVDVVAAGFPVQAFVTLEIAQGALDEVTAELAALPAVLEAYATTGTSDVLCRLAASSHEHLQQTLLTLNRSPDGRPLDERRGAVGRGGPQGAAAARTEPAQRAAAGPRVPGHAVTARGYWPRASAVGGQEAVAEGVHPPDRGVGGGLQAVLPAPAGDPVQHRRVVGDDRDRHVPAGVVAGDGRDGLVVAEEDEHRCSCRRTSPRRRSGCSASTRWTVRYSVRTRAGLFHDLRRGSCPPSRCASKTEPSPRSFQSIVVRDRRPGRCGWRPG